MATTESLHEFSIRLRETAEAEKAAAAAVDKVIELRERGDTFIPYPFHKEVPAQTEPAGVPAEPEIPAGAETRLSPENGKAQYRLPGRKVWLYADSGKRVSAEGLGKISAARMRRAHREARRKKVHQMQRPQKKAA